jgi:dihydrofolate synthase/folylpolyglutamate synthase
MAAGVLRQTGRHVGIYTSPHLVDVRERMVVDGRPVSREAFCSWTNLLRRDIERTGASFFEASTAIAFADFAARGVDIAVIEVGLGGRLDATNVVDPLVSGVISLGLEHTDYLGSSLRKVAGEKAGIAKAGRPFVVGEAEPAIAAMLEEAGLRARARVHVVPREASYLGPVGMPGRHQRRNAAVAEAMLGLLPPELAPTATDVARGIATSWLPGRFDRRGKWLFDVAHNPDAMVELTECLREAELPRPVHAVVGMLRDKDAVVALRILQREVDAIWITVPPSVPCERRRDLGPLVSQPGLDLVAEADFDRALETAQQGASTVLVTGSFHTVGDAMNRLPGFAPLG